MSGNVQDVLPLSPAQEGLLFHTLRDTEGPDPYLVQARFRIGPGVEPARVRAALTALLDRHPNLRACFRHENLRRPVQIVPRAVRVPWREADLTGLGADEADARTRRLLESDAARRFDPARPPLVRGTLVRRDTGDELVLTFHHLLLDGWSMPVLEADLAALTAGRPLPPAAPYRDYLAWLARQDRDKAQAAWTEALADLEAPVPLLDGNDGRDGRDGGGAAGDTGEAGAHTLDRAQLHLSAGLSAALARRAKEAGVTLNTLVQAAWALVLARTTGSRDVVFGAVVSGRPHDLHGVESMVGLFVNTLPVRVRLRAGETADELLVRLQDEQSRLAAHQHARLADIQRAAGAGELFDSVLAFENFPQRGDDEPGPGELSLVHVADATHYPVTLAVTAGERLWLSVGCRGGLSASGLAARTSRALELLASGPGRQVDDLDVLPPDEHRRLTGLAAGPVRRQAQPGTVTGLFASWAARTPDAPAVESDDGVLTYAALDAASDALAARLVVAGAAPGDTVALVLPRSPGTVVAQLAVLKAGARWLPLDPAQPALRLAELVREAGVRLALTTGTTAAVLPDGVTALDVHGPAPAVRPPLPRPLPGSGACVLYTSGSTGEPKGVVVPHRAVAELAADARFRGGAHRRVLAHAPYTFDSSTYEVWVPLLNGGTVVVAPPGPVTPELLDRVIPGRGVTALFLTPELLRTLAEIAPGALSGTTEVWAGGDVLDPATVSLLREHCPGVTVVNGYGPTETTVFATAHTADGSPGPVPVGRPLDNTRAHVLDALLRPVPEGGTGELYLAGTGLADGYLARPGQTAERFVADPDGPPGARMYRTGDLARRRGDGLLDFRGRADDQLKVRGVRIEPAEVEAVLAACPGVRRAVVGARTDAAGGKRLAAWLRPETPKNAADAAGGADGATDTTWPELLATVQEFAARRLPAHLVPSVWARVGRIPLTRHGKTDRAALPEPSGAAPVAAGARAPRAPRDERERLLCARFAEVLGLPGVHPDTDFFAAGGHSLTALRLASTAGVSLADLFAAPTPARLAARTAPTPGTATGVAAGPGRGSARGSDLAPLLTLRSGGDRTPLFCVHPALGLGWSFAALLPHLRPDRPVHALQSPALTESGGPAARHPDSVAAVAEEYTARIRALVPNGPYALVGRSFGGTVAHEIAVRLRRDGQEVRLLAVLDAMPQPPDTPRVPDDLAEQESLRILLNSHAPGRPAPPGRFGRAEAFAVIRAAGQAPAALDDRVLHAMTDNGVRHIHLATAWRPSRYDGPVTLFSATRRAHATTTEKAAAWRPVTGALDVRELDCGHSGVLQPDQAAQVAEVLETLLRRSER